MTFSGYDPDRFVGSGHQAFQCPICIQVVLDPYECHQCGKLFCKNCIVSWSTKPTGTHCPNRCSGPTTNIKPIFSKALQRMYLNLDIRCSNPKCNKSVKLMDLPAHQAKCLLAKCWNYDNCEQPAKDQIKALKPCCSELCSTQLSLTQKFGDKKAMYEVIIKYAGAPQKMQQQQPIKTNSANSFNGNTSIATGPITSIAWDPTKTGGGIQLSEGGVHCFLKEQSYLFRTTIGNQGFTSGVHYWEIIADSRTENQLKIGVTSSTHFDYNSAFCDHPFGFAYYGLGQLRHGSNAAGPAYGKKFKKEGTLGVLLNMNTGVLAFSLNGQYMGVAYRDPKLTQGPIYPAVALLHCAGCKLRAGLPVPSYFKD